MLHTATILITSIACMGSKSTTSLTGYGIKTEVFGHTSHHKAGCINNYYGDHLSSKVEIIINF